MITDNSETEFNGGILDTKRQCHQTKRKLLDTPFFLMFFDILIVFSFSFFDFFNIFLVFLNFHCYPSKYLQFDFHFSRVVYHS
jgi:hypothetical protein